MLLSNSSVKNLAAAYKISFDKNTEFCIFSYINPNYLKIFAVFSLEIFLMIPDVKEPLILPRVGNFYDTGYGAISREDPSVRSEKMSSLLLTCPHSAEPASLVS